MAARTSSSHARSSPTPYVEDPRVRLAVQRLAGSIDADLGRVVQDLIVAESVPYLATHRYRDSGMATRNEWEHVWDLQRKEDAIDALGLPSDRAARRKADEVGDIPDSAEVQAGGLPEDRLLASARQARRA